LKELDLLPAELRPFFIWDSLHAPIQKRHLSHGRSLAVEVVSTRHRTAVKEKADLRIVGRAEALNVDTAALRLRDIQIMQQGAV